MGKGRARISLLSFCPRRPSRAVLAGGPASIGKAVPRVPARRRCGISPARTRNSVPSALGSARVFGRFKHDMDISASTARAHHAGVQSGERHVAPARPNESFKVEFGAVATLRRRSCVAERAGAARMNPPPGRKRFAQSLDWHENIKRTSAAVSRVPRTTPHARPQRGRSSQTEEFRLRSATLIGQELGTIPKLPRLFAVSH